MPDGIDEALDEASAWLDMDGVVSVGQGEEGTSADQHAERDDGDHGDAHA